MTTLCADPVAKRVHFPNLDGLRTIAFLAVYLSHGFGDVVSGISIPWPAIDVLRAFIFRSGDIGVQLFFVLSGFLITYLILSEIESTGRLNLKAFYIRRTLRVWPLFFVVVGVGLLLREGFNLQAPSAPDDAILPYVAFFSNIHMIQSPAPLFLGITWSVAIEEQFYIFWPIVFWLAPRRYHRLVFPVVIGFSLLFRTVFRDYGLYLYIHSLSVMSDLAVGGLLAYCAQKRPAFCGYVQKMPRALIATMFAVGMLMLVFREAVYFPVDSVWATAIRAALVIVRRVVLSLFFAFLIAEQNWAENSMFKVSSSKLLSSLGKYTYGLYLLHPLALMAAFMLLGHRLPPQLGGGGPIPPPIVGGLACGFLGLILSLALSIASYHLFEARFLAIKKRFSVIESG